MDVPPLLYIFKGIPKVRREYICCMDNDSFQIMCRFGNWLSRFDNSEVIVYLGINTMIDRKILVCDMASHPSTYKILSPNLYRLHNKCGIFPV